MTDLLLCIPLAAVLLVFMAVTEPRRPRRRHRADR